MPKANKGSTLSLEVHARVREDILSGRLEPGSRLKVAGLAAQNSVSPSVVREALTRLAEQGLVISEPQLGFRVQPLSTDDLRDLTRLRMDIDALALRGSLQNGDLEWEAQLVATHHKLARTPPFVEGDPTQVSLEWTVAHGAFHNALLAGCGSPRLIDLAATLRDSAEVYRRWSFRRDGATRDFVGEHQSLLDTSLRRDLDHAENVLRTHSMRTAQALLDALLLLSEGTDVRAIALISDSSAFERPA